MNTCIYGCAEEIASNKVFIELCPTCEEAQQVMLDEYSESVGPYILWRGPNLT